MNLEERIGTLIKNIPTMHETEYEVRFNLHENTFFKKLAPEEILGTVRIKAVDYFKSIVFLSYFSRIIEGNYQICDNLVKISKAVRAEEKENGKDSGASYLPITAVVLETGLYSQGKNYSREKTNIKNRYSSNLSTVDLSNPTRQGEPYYEAIGKMVCDMVSDERKDYFNSVSSRREIEALVFTDCTLNVITDAKCKSKANNLLKKKDYFGASMAAFEGLRKEASLAALQSNLEKHMMEVLK